MFAKSLSQDIRNLLTDWAEELADCDRIFIRASVSNRRIFLDYDGAVLEKGTFSHCLITPRYLMLRRRYSSQDVPLPYAETNAIRTSAMPARAHPCQDLTSHRRCTPRTRRSLPCITSQTKARPCACVCTTPAQSGKAEALPGGGCTTGRSTHLGR